MKAQKDVKTGKWLIQYRYTDWQGIRRKSTKRGFNTKREAEEWLRNFLQSQQADFNMKFEEFIKLYYEDMKPRIRENTMNTKKYIIDLKILPFFGKKSVNKITPADVRKWQNELISQGYSQTYLRTINNQLTAIFNFAVRYYDLKSNPCTKAGSMGKNSADEMKFWTKEEFSEFIDGVMDKQKSYVAFMTLFWTGIRVGELLALTPADINFEERTISVSKSYQRLGGKDVVTPPKTPKSNRVITVPDFLLADIKDYMNRIYCLESTDRLFNMTKSFLEKEMHLSVYDYEKKMRKQEVEELTQQTEKLNVKVEELTAKYETLTKYEVKIDELTEDFYEQDEFKLPEPPPLMTARTYKTKFIEPLFNKLIGLVKGLAKQCMELQSRVFGMKVGAGLDKRKVNELYEDNSYLREENQELVGDVLKFRLLRKVFGDEEVDKLVDKATELERESRRARNRSGWER